MKVFTFESLALYRILLGDFTPEQAPNLVQALAGTLRKRPSFVVPCLWFLFSFFFWLHFLILLLLLLLTKWQKEYFN